MTQFAQTIFFVFLLCGCVSSGEQPGHGYRIVHHSEDMRGAAGQFEGVIDFTDLYHGQQRLGTTGYYSISPSGRFALFKDEETHRLILFDRQSGKMREVEDDTYLIPRRTKWREPAGVVDVYHVSENASSHIPLNH